MVSRSRVVDFHGASRVVDFTAPAAGSDLAITDRQPAGSGLSIQFPDASVAENAALGTLLGALTVAGAAVGDTWEFSLDDDAAGAVALDT